MMLDPTSQLSVSYLVIYPFILLPIFYVLFQHGKYGILGWGYLIAFCVLRMTGSGLQLSHPSSTVAATLSSIGLSPLILAILGVLHESSLYICGRKAWPLKIPFYIGMHVAVAIATALLASGRHSLNSTTGVGKVGSILFLLIWLLIIGLAILSYRHPKPNEAHLLHRGVIISLPFIGIRIIYTVASTFVNSINAYTGPLVYRVIFDSMMEYFDAIALLIFGVITRHICRNKGPRNPESRPGAPLQQ